MKSSIKFREEKCPLLRAKLPFNVGPIALLSGFAIGNSQDLCLHIGTFFSAGPAVKLAFKPNDSNPLSLVVKTGLGLWGSPSGGAVTVTAEFNLVSKGKDPVFCVRFKPRIGDFSIRKDINAGDFLPAQQKASPTSVTSLQWNENGDLSNSSTPHKLENGASPAFMNGDLKTSYNRRGNNAVEKDRSRSPSMDSVVIGSNFSFKIEGFEKDWKAKGERKRKTEEVKEHDAEVDTPRNENNLSVHDDVSLEHIKGDGHRFSPAFSFSSAQSSLQGSKIIAHSSLPLGRQAKLNIRWGVKPPPDVFQGLDGITSSLSFSKLPSLLLDKVSFEQCDLPVNKNQDVRSPAVYRGYPEQGLLPAGFVEENRELAQVATMCYSMKRQLQLMHAENQVLRRAMEEMRSQVGQRSAWSFNSIENSSTGKEQGPARSSKTSFLESPKVFDSRRDEIHREVDAASKRSRDAEGGGKRNQKAQRDTDNKKTQKEMPKKELETDVMMLSPASSSTDMSEFEKAILNAKAGSGSAKE